MSGWNCDQYNRLLREISKIGSVRDAEAMLYRMIQHHQQQPSNDHPMGNVFVTDETFYHVFASYRYQYQLKLQRRNKKVKNRGIGFKVEQLLAIQDASANQQNEFVTTSTSNGAINPIQPSLQTLKAVLYVLTLDRYDNKIALRAQRIWDRMLQMYDENTPNNDTNSNTAIVIANAVLSTLICCTHVPRLTATPADKLSSFTVALECFNWATSRPADPAAPHAPQHQTAVYRHFFRACRVLLSDMSESKRDAVVDAAFRRACTNGYVDTKVVLALEECASDALMLRLLGGFVEDGQDLPNEWGRNCMAHRKKQGKISAVSNDR